MEETNNGDSSPDYLNRKWVLTAFVLSLPLYWFFDHLGEPGRARAASIGGGLIILTVRMRWDLRKHVWFWATIALLVLLHVPLILFTRWTNVNLPGPTLLPFAVVDIGIMYGCVKLVEKAMKSS